MSNRAAEAVAREIANRWMAGRATPIAFESIASIITTALNTRERETVKRCAVIAEAINDSIKDKGKFAAAILNPEICIVPLNAEGKVGLQSEHVLDNEEQCVYCGEFRATVRDDEG